MQNTKLTELLKSFNAQDFKMLGKYLQSPYYNTNKNIIGLYNFLKKYFPDFEQSTFTKQKAWKSIFGTKPYHEQRFSNLMSEFSRLIYGFWVAERIKSKERTQKLLLLEHLRGLKLEQAFMKVWKNVKKNLDGEDYRTSDYYFTAFRLEELTYQLDVYTHGRLVNSNLEKVTNQLDYYYLATKLKYYCALLNRQQHIVEGSTDTYLPDEFIQFFEQGKMDEVPDILIWYRLMLLLKKGEDDESHYTKMMEVIQEHGGLLHKDELRQVYGAIFNYCNKQYKSGKEHFLRIIFDVLKKMLEQEVIIFEGYITPYLYFRNIVMVALQVGEIDWAEQFIEEYQEKVELKYRENMVVYCKAALFFHKKEYDKVLEYLFDFELKDFYQYMEHKVLLIKTYYELEEEISLESLLESMRIYLIRSTQMPEHYKKAYGNFVKFMQQLCKWNTGFFPEKIKDLTKKIEQAEKLVEKKWLLEKVKQ